jgi:hypothetical protein
MNNKRKKYVGSFTEEKDAAVLYDKVAILTHGLKVVSNTSLSFFVRQKLISDTRSINLLKF